MPFDYCRDPFWMPDASPVEFHAFMRNMEDLDGRFPTEDKMKQLLEHAKNIMLNGSSTIVAARMVRRANKLPVPFLSKYDILETLNAAMMRASAVRRLGRAKAGGWNTDVRGRKKLVQEHEKLARAAGYAAKLYTEENWGGDVQSEDDILPTTSSSSQEPISDIVPQRREIEMAQAMLAMSTGRRFRSTRHTVTSLVPEPASTVSPEEEDEEILEQLAPPRRRRNARGACRTTVTAPAEHVDVVVSQESASQDVREETLKKGTKRPYGTSHTVHFRPGDGKASLGTSLVDFMNGVRSGKNLPPLSPSALPTPGSGLAPRARPTEESSAPPPAKRTKRAAKAPAAPVAPGPRTIRLNLAPSSGSPERPASRPTTIRLNVTPAVVTPPDDSGISVESDGSAVVAQPVVTVEQEYEMISNGAMNLEGGRQTRRKRPNLWGQ